MRKYIPSDEALAHSPLTHAELANQHKELSVPHSAPLPWVVERPDTVAIVAPPKKKTKQKKQKKPKKKNTKTG
jgi:hypothetical protein